MSMNGKAALITGGNSGIGLGTARRLVQEGAFVYLTGRNQERLDAVQAELGDQVKAIRADVTSRADMEHVAAMIAQDRDRLDLVFANAGSALYSTIEDLTDDELTKGLDIDIRGTIHTVQVTLPLLGEGSSIIVNTSITQTMGLPSFGVYSATKSALRSFVRTWMNELRERRIRVNAVSPGVIETEVFVKDYGEENAAAYLEQAAREIPAGRVGQPADIAAAVVFLASEDASFINGTELTIDGGQTQIHPGGSAL